MSEPKGSSLPESPFLGQEPRWPLHGSIVIEVRGGCVACVSSDVNDLDVTVIDYDDEAYGGEKQQEPDRAQYQYELWP